MWCTVCGKVHIKDPLLLIRKSSLCSDSRFPLKKYVTVTICLMSNSWYENQCAVQASLNKTSIPFFPPSSVRKSTSDRWTCRWYWCCASAHFESANKSVSLLKLYCSIEQILINQVSRTDHCCQRISKWIVTPKLTIFNQRYFYVPSTADYKHMLFQEWLTIHCGFVTLCFCFYKMASFIRFEKLLRDTHRAECQLCKLKPTIYVSKLSRA